MLLQALYEYASQNKLLEHLPIQRRTLHALVSLNLDGTLRIGHLLPLSHKDVRQRNTDNVTTDEPGQDRYLPRFPGENNGGKAYFLAESATAVFARDRKTGQPISSDPKVGKNSTKAFVHFWQQISDAHHATKDNRLGALMQFRQRYIREIDGFLTVDLQFLKIVANRKGESELRADFGSENWREVRSATVGFAVDGQPLVLEDSNDPIYRYWFTRYMQLETEECRDSDGSVANDKVSDLEPDGEVPCLITGRRGQRIARSHKPKILGVPGLTSGGYVVSFATASPAFSSFGFSMGQNAPVSQAATAAYALALNDLLASTDHRIKIGPVAVCFWAKHNQSNAKWILKSLNDARPKQVTDWHKKWFAGVQGDPAWKNEQLYNVALTGNQGRVVVRHWLSQPLESAAANVQKWFNDLEIKEFYGAPGSIAIPNLARATLRKSRNQKDGKLIGDRISLLYSAALEGLPLPVTILQPILQEFQAALLKDSDDEQTYPFNTSRFALIKLILLRDSRLNKKENAFMPTCELSETADPAYNCGRLLAVLENTQKRSLWAGSESGTGHKPRRNAGVIERYYGRASIAPRQVFPLLLKLSRHHLSKLQKGTESDRRAADALEARVAEIIARLRSSAGSTGGPPEFPGLLSLREQGVFAIGFYQQKAAEKTGWREPGSTDHPAAAGEGADDEESE